MTTEFRDAIGWAVFGDPIGDDDGSEAREAIGNDVLAMPEMQAIRRVLRKMSRDWGRHQQALGWTADKRAFLHDLGLPESVIDWVIGDDDE